MTILNLAIFANGLLHDEIELNHTQDGFRLNDQPITAPEARQLWDTVSKALHQDEDNDRLERDVGAVLNGGRKEPVQVIRFSGPNGTETMTRNGKTYLVKGRPRSLLQAFRWHVKMEHEGDGGSSNCGELFRFLRAVSKTNTEVSEQSSRRIGSFRCGFFLGLGVGEFEAKLRLPKACVRGRGVSKAEMCLFPAALGRPF